LRNLDAGVAQHVLSGAIEASPDLASWLADVNDPKLSAAYFHMFINGLARK
jgi:hypothetical protein